MFLNGVIFMTFKIVLGIVTMLVLFSSASHSQCVNESKTNELLNQIQHSLRDSIPEIDRFPSLVDKYFVYDLSDTSNNTVLKIDGEGLRGCPKFVDRHVYHFSVTYVPFSRSSIGVLEKGKLRIFRSINCVSPDSQDSVDEIINYLAKRGIARDQDEMLERVRKYRSYGYFQATDEKKVRCDN